jgi:hypothetical protein
MLEMLNGVPGIFIARRLNRSRIILYKADIYPHNRRVKQGTLQDGRTK